MVFVCFCVFDFVLFSGVLCVSNLLWWVGITSSRTLVFGLVCGYGLLVFMYLFRVCFWLMALCG